MVAMLHLVIIFGLGIMLFLIPGEAKTKHPGIANEDPTFWEDCKGAFRYAYTYMPIPKMHFALKAVLGVALCFGLRYLFLPNETRAILRHLISGWI